jgi:hypothetical protein
MFCFLFEISAEIARSASMYLEILDLLRMCALAGIAVLLAAFYCNFGSSCILITACLVHPLPPVSAPWVRSNLAPSSMYTLCSSDWLEVNSRT